MEQFLRKMVREDTNAIVNRTTETKVLNKRRRNGNCKEFCKKIISYHLLSLQTYQ